MCSVLRVLVWGEQHSSKCDEGYGQRKHTHKRTRAHTHTHENTYKQAHKHAHTHARTHPHTHASTHTRTLTKTHTSKQTHTHTHKQAYRHARTLTNTNTHTQKPKSWNWFSSIHLIVMKRCYHWLVSMDAKCSPINRGRQSVNTSYNQLLPDARKPDRRQVNHTDKKSSVQKCKLQKAPTKNKINPPSLSSGSYLLRRNNLKG